MARAAAARVGAAGARPGRSRPVGRCRIVSCSRRRVSPAASTPARPCSTPPAGSAPTSTRCAAAAASAAGVRSCPGVGSFAKWGIDATAEALSPPASLELDYHGNRPLLAGQRLGCSARICGDVVIDVPAMSQVHRQVVRKDLDLAPIVVDPTFSLFYVEVAPAELGDAVERVRDAAQRRRRTTRPLASRRRRTGPPRRAPGARPRRWRSDGRAPSPRRRRRSDRCCVAGLRRCRPRHRGRHRLDHDRRSPLRSLDRRGAGERRADEPPDPVRRGPDEPGVVRDDESRRRARAHRRRAHRARRVGRRARRRRRCRPRARPRDRARREPDHAPHRARHRPDAARVGAVRARHRRGGRRAGARSRPRPAGCARSTPGRASPVTSAPTRPRRCSPRARTEATRCSCSSTSARTPRSCSATAPASTPRRARPDRRSRVRRSAAGNAPRRAPSSAYGSTASRSSRRSR